MCWEGRGDEKPGYLKMVTTLHFPHGTEVYEGVGSPQGSVVKDQSEDRFSPVSSAFVCVCVFVFLFFLYFINDFVIFPIRKSMFSIH